MCRAGRTKRSGGAPGHVEQAPILVRPGQAQGRVHDRRDGVSHPGIDQAQRGEDRRHAEGREGDLGPASPDFGSRPPGEPADPGPNGDEQRVQGKPDRQHPERNAHPPPPSLAGPPHALAPPGLCVGSARVVACRRPKPPGRILHRCEPLRCRSRAYGTAPTGLRSNRRGHPLSGARRRTGSSSGPRMGQRARGGWTWTVPCKTARRNETSILAFR